MYRLQSIYIYFRNIVDIYVDYIANASHNKSMNRKYIIFVTFSPHPTHISRISHTMHVSRMCSMSCTKSSVPCTHICYGSHILHRPHLSNTSHISDVSTTAIHCIGPKHSTWKYASSVANNAIFCMLVT